MAEPARTYYQIHLAAWQRRARDAVAQRNAWQTALADFEKEEDELVHGRWAYSEKERARFEDDQTGFMLLAFTLSLLGSVLVVYNATESLSKAFYFFPCLFFISAIVCIWKCFLLGAKIHKRHPP